MDCLEPFKAGNKFIGIVDSSNSFSGKGPDYFLLPS